MQFGRSSERITRQIEQLELQLEELETGEAEDTARAEADRSAGTDPPRAAKPKRKPLPDHLPRQEIVHQPADDGACTCPDCGGGWPSSARTSPRCWTTCRATSRSSVTSGRNMPASACDAITQAPAPAMPTPRGRATPATLAHLLVSKYCDHLPLYRQSEIYAREGLELDRSTLCDWVGQAAWLLEPSSAAIRRHVFAAEKIHGDDTTVPVLAPGLGRTKTGRLWVYVRDDRPFCGAAPPAAAYFYSPDRGGEHPATHWPTFTGFLQADGYAGFEALYDRAARDCARADHRSRVLGALPPQVLRRVGAPRSRRSPRRRSTASPRSMSSRPRPHSPPPPSGWHIRTETAPLLDTFFAWAEATVAKLSAKSALAEAFRYTIKRREALSRFVTDGRLEIDNNIAENAMRIIATPGSLCTSSSSIWKHWKLIAGIDVTRASFTPDRLHHGRRVQVRGPDLERRAGNNLLGAKDASLDQLAYPVAGNAASLSCLAQGQPGPVLLGGLVGMNAADTADRADPVRCPGLALPGWQAHPVERGRDVLIGPAARHAANDRQGVVGGAACVFTRAGLTQAQFRVLSAFPMDDQNDLPRPARRYRR